jgi:ribosome maturation factor RimP
VTLDHCERVSREASALLDTEDFGAGRYVLEVSSPGLDRELYRPRDWKRFVGKTLRVTFRDPEGKKKTIHGRLQGFEPEDGGTAEVLEQEAGELLRIPLDRVQRAKLEIEL